MLYLFCCTLTLPISGNSCEVEDRTHHEWQAPSECAGGCRVELPSVVPSGRRRRRAAVRTSDETKSPLESRTGISITWDFERRGSGELAERVHLPFPIREKTVSLFFVAFAEISFSIVQHNLFGLKRFRFVCLSGFFGTYHIRCTRNCYTWSGI